MKPTTIIVGTLGCVFILLAIVMPSEGTSRYIIPRSKIHVAKTQYVRPHINRRTGLVKPYYRAKKGSLKPYRR